MDRGWHERHALPKNASLAERIAWHRGHQARCACRPVPQRLREQVEGRRRKARDPAIDEYLARTSPENRALLRALRRTIRAVVPDVEECIRYRIPAFRLEGRVIAGFSATSKGCSYYPFSGRTLATLAGDLEGYEKTKSALHFGPGKPLPPSRVRKLLRARIAEG